MSALKLAKIALTLVIMAPVGALFAKSFITHPQGGPMPQCGYYCEYKGNPTYCCFNNPN